MKLLYSSLASLNRLFSCWMWRNNFSTSFSAGFLVMLPALLTTHPAVAQKFSPGYVLLNNGDTLHGLIETENWVKAPVKVRFKKSPGAEIHTYSPLLIHSFRIKDGDWYFSFVGDIDPSSLLDDKLNYSPLPDTLRVFMFIRSVVMGKVCLYYARDMNDRLHLFIQKDGGIITELKYKKYYLDERVVADYRNEITRRAIMANQIYKEQLTNLMADCPPVATGIVSRPLAYSKNDIMKLVIDYNRCKSSRTSYKEEKEAWRFEIRGHVGVNYSGLKFKSTTNTYVGDSDFENSLGYAFGLSLNCVLPRTNESWGFFNEMIIRDFNSQGVSGTAEFKEQRPVKMDLIYAKLATMVRYQFTGSEAQPFLEAGITNGIALKSANLESDSSGISSNFIQYFRNYEQGLIFGTGLQWKDVSWDVQLEFSNGMSGYSDVKSAFATLYVTMGYKF
ncbi:MAG TPA: outer membrane beta-barrel protein [Chitinophagales bacterium]|nr:outer membrane beta-barrel protein [Chitinophagales bacterium]